MDSLRNMHANYLTSQNLMWVSVTWLCQELLSNLCLSDFDWQVKGNIEGVCGPRVLQQWECQPSSERSDHSRAATRRWDASQMLFISCDVYLYWWRVPSACPCVPAAADKQHKLPCHNQTCPVFQLRKRREVVGEGKKVGRRGKYGQVK